MTFDHNFGISLAAKRKDYTAAMSNLYERHVSLVYL
jgi:hypothetical protein